MPLQRNSGLDLLRGLLLLMMAMVHLPTSWSERIGQPLGFVSAAEGFVFLSAFLVGNIFLVQQDRSGFIAATRWLMGRAMRLYLFHIALLVLAFTLVARIATTYQTPAVLNLLDFYFLNPQEAAIAAVILAYQPPLLDILPMYVLFFLCTPVVMRLASLWGWYAILGVSFVIWVLAQFGLRVQFYSFLINSFGWRIPVSATGAFDLFAWQFLWVLGVWFGADGRFKLSRVLVSMPSVLMASFAIFGLFFLWRLWSGPSGFSDPLWHFLWIDKWTLSPVRVINLSVIVCILFGTKETLSGLRMLPIERLGQSSQWVFVVHIATTLLLLCFVGQFDEPLGGYVGLLVMVVGIGALFATARIHRRVKKIRVGFA
ncbi:MAG TPA: OpgC domain-containing protein [Candidatus Macondimonas sp.]|nr:OpgC domain-containing protein [Candidatus Macondimonas sp.]